MPRLFVNLDHVATVRQARGTPYPDVTEAAHLATSSGAIDGITLHLREDRRHVNDEDLRRVGREISLPLNFEMSTAPDVVDVCLEVRPPIATLVPERREEVTTEGGLDLERHGARILEVSKALQANGTRVSLFIEAREATVGLAKELGADAIELHTGPYVHAHEDAAPLLQNLHDAAVYAGSLDLEVNAGHGLTLDNVGPVAALPGLADLNIGHAIVARALFVGLPAALVEMREAIAKGAASG